MPTRAGFHAHRCSNCGNVWCHSDSMANNQEAHRCSGCGKFQFWKYEAKGYAIPAFWRILEGDNSAESIPGYGDDVPGCLTLKG